MITIGLLLEYCCQDNQYYIYKIYDRLSDDLLNKLKYYTGSQDDIYKSNILNEIPYNLLNYEICDNDTYNSCDYKLYGLVCNYCLKYFF